VRGTVLYFVVSDMSLIDPMYQYSLHYFKKLFKLAMEQTKASELLQERLINLEETITRNIFADICRGLFESHKKIFSFLICTSIRRRAGAIGPNSWNLFLRGAAPIDAPKSSNPDKIFLKDTTWNFILASAELVAELSAWPNDVKQNIIYWKDFLTQDDIFTAGFPI
jgi:dynein heavy chain